MQKNLDNNIRYSNVRHVTYDTTVISTYNDVVSHVSNVSNLTGCIQRLYNYLYLLNKSTYNNFVSTLNELITTVSYVTYDPTYYRVLYGD